MMPTVNDLKNSRFLTKEDADPDVLVTIKSYEKMDVSMENQATDIKWVLLFKEFEKPLVLNITNGKKIAKIVGSDDFDKWLGAEIVLWNDPDIEFAGETTGGIRVRARKGGQPNPEHVGDNPESPKDDIPF